MTRFAAVTDEDLARARRDPAFRQQLLTENLGALIDELSRRQRPTRRSAAATAAQLREGAELAVKLADLISEIDGQAPAATAGGPETAAQPVHTQAASQPRS